MLLDLFAHALRIFFPVSAQESQVPHEREPGVAEEALHHVFVHAGGRAQHAGADVSEVSQLEQALDGAVLAKGAVQHGKDDVHVDGAIFQAALRDIAFEGRERIARHWRDDDGLTFRQQRRSGRGLGVAGAQMLGARKLAAQQLLGAR